MALCLEGCTRHQISDRLLWKGSGKHHIAKAMRAILVRTGAISQKDPRFVIGCAIMLADAKYRQRNRTVIDAIERAQVEQTRADLEKYLQ